MVPSANNDSPIDNINWPQAERYWMAFSGGMDSTALLHMLAQNPEIKQRLQAIHINHQINPDAVQWAQNCQDFCDELGVPLITATVDLPDHSENSCRQARLKVYQQQLSPGDCLITAHHQNDQVETLLFRLLRGTGLNGLTGMQQLSSFEHYSLFKPLLNTSKQTLIDYIKQHNLTYIDDPSNQNSQYRRNHIRNEILPMLAEHNPNVINNLSTTRENLERSQQLLSKLIGHVNPMVVDPQSTANELSTRLYHWLTNLKIRPPSHARLDQYASDCIEASNDRVPELQFERCQLCHWQNKIYAVKTPLPEPQAMHDVLLTTDNPLKLVGNNGEIELSSNHSLAQNISIKYGQNHERVLMAENRPHQSCKNLFQQLQVPPWQRPLLPFVYFDGQLMAIGNDIRTAPFKTWLQQHKAEYRWHAAPHLL